MEEVATTTKSSPSPLTTAQSPPDHGGSPGEPPVQDKDHREPATGVLVRPQIDAKIKRPRQVLGTGDRRVDQQRGQSHRNDPEAPAGAGAGAEAKPKQQPPPATAQDPEGIPARQGREATSPEEKMIVEADDQAERQQQQEQKRLKKYSTSILLFQAVVYGVFYSRFSLSTSSSAPAPPPPPPPPGAPHDNNTWVNKVFFYIAFLANTFSVALCVLKPLLQWRRGLAWVTWIFLEISAYLFLVSLNRWYAFAILAFPLFFLPISITFLMRRKGGDQDDKALKYIFDISAGLVGGSGVVGAISGSPTISSALGSTLDMLFFCVIAIGLYLMLITTVRTEMLVVHAKSFFAILLLLVLAAGTILTATE